MQYHLFVLFHLINKFKSGLDVAVVIYVLKEHFEGAYPDLGLVVYLHIHYLLFIGLMVMSHVQNNIVAALEMLVMAADNDLPALGYSCGGCALGSFLLYRRRLCLYLFNRLFLSLGSLDLNRCGLCFLSLCSFFLYGSGSICINKDNGVVLGNSYPCAAAAYIVVLACKAVCQTGIVGANVKGIVSVADVKSDIDHLTVQLTLIKEGLFFSSSFL